MRLAFVSFSQVPFGSIDVLWHRVAKRALSEGHQVLAVSYDWGIGRSAKYDELLKCGAALHFIRRELRSPNFFVRQWNKILSKFRDDFRQWQFLSEFKPDLILIADPGTVYAATVPGFADYLLTSGIPFLPHSHYNDENSTFAEGAMARIRSYFGAARQCLFVSERNLEVARRQLCLPLTNAIVIDTPANLESFEPQPYPEQQPVIQMAVVARLDSELKGQALVLAALAQTQWRDRSWHLSLYGTGPDEKYLANLINFLGLQDRVCLCGQASNVRIIWEEHHLLILCSSGEGKPLTICETMICARPSVVTDVGGNAELVEDGVTGFVAKAPTLELVADALERAWQARDQWPEMGATAHETILRRYSPPPEERLWQILTSVPQVRAEGQRF